MIFRLFLFKSAAIILGIFLAIVIVEIFARILYQEPWYERLDKTQRSSETYRYTKNKDGLRDVDYPVTKPSTHRRILILGDSYTFGLGVPTDEDTFPEVLETKLNQQVIYDDIKKIEVLNGGISGSIPPAWLTLYKKVSSAFDPDLVLIVFYLRDGTKLQLQRGFFKRIFKEITIKNRASRLYQYFFTYRLIKDLFDRSAISTSYTEKLINAYLGDNKQTIPWRAIQEHLLSIKKIADKHSAEVAFVIFPALVELNKNYPFMKVCKHLEEFALSNEFHVHNLLPSFMGYYGPNLWVSTYDQHPNEKAHRIAAASLLPFIKDLLIAHEKKGEKDEDRDGIPTAVDNCPNMSNTRQEDKDGDNYGNACDNCPNDYNPNQVDTDEDEKGDTCDNCYSVFNPNQQDSNGDGIGDACASIKWTNIWLEAEHADTIISPFEVANDANASNGKFIYAQIQP